MSLVNDGSLNQMDSSLFLTSCPFSGNFTVVNCSSLYFSNAGVREGRRSGSSDVNVLMSIIQQK